MNGREKEEKFEEDNGSDGKMGEGGWGKEMSESIV